MTKAPAAKPVLMVVDDEPSQRKLIGGFFEGHGFTIMEAESAESMLDSLAQQPPDMILLDVRLPAMSGIDALPRIRELLPTIPVVLITAYADVRQAVASVKSGADDYLSKPIDLEELKVAVYDALAIRTSEDAENKIAIPELPDEFIVESRAMRQLRRDRGGRRAVRCSDSDSRPQRCRQRVDCTVDSPVEPTCIASDRDCKLRRSIGDTHRKRAIWARERSVYRSVGRSKRPVSDSQWRQLVPG